MQDRLSELRRVAGTEPEREELNEKTDKSNDYLNREHTGGVELMPEFLSKSKQVQELIETIRSNNDELKKLKVSHKNATLAEKEKQISVRMNTLVDETNRANHAVKDLLTEMGSDIDNSKKLAPDEPETRMKINTHTALTNRFAEVLKETQSVEVEIQHAVREKITRQAKLIDENLTDDQIKDICQDPEGASKLIASKMFGQSHIRLQNAVSDIQDKYRDIQKLENSVQIVFQMTQDLALLVHAQGEMLDNIELNINNAQDYVRKGEKELRTAKENQQASRKRLCLLVVCGLVLLMVIIGPLIGIAAKSA